MSEELKTGNKTQVQGVQAEVRPEAAGRAPGTEGLAHNCLPFTLRTREGPIAERPVPELGSSERLVCTKSAHLPGSTIRQRLQAHGPLSPTVES